MTPPVVSVIVPTRDRPALLHTAVESVLQQSLRDVEVVVVDDGPREPARLPPDPRVRVVRLPASRGLAAALNAGAHEARGRWLATVDDDDRLLPHMLEASLEAVERSALPPPVAALSGVEFVRPDGTVTGQLLPPTSPRGSHYSLEPIEPGRSYIVRATLVVERSLVLELGGWDEAFRGRPRHELLLRLNPVCSLQGVDRVGYQVLQHDGDRRLSYDHQLMHEAFQLLVDKHRALFESHPRRYAHYLRADARRLHALGRRPEAALALARAVRYDRKRTLKWVRRRAHRRLARVERSSPAPERIEGGRIAYVLKMFPRFSETFVLNEILELERQGLPLRIFSLKEPTDGIVHRDVELVRGAVTYIRWREPLAVARAHARVLRRSPARYARTLLPALRRRRFISVKYFLKAGVIADHVQREGIRHVHAHFASSAASATLDVHLLTGVPYSFTAHAKDIYRDDIDTEYLRTKLAEAQFAVTVSEYNRRHLDRLGGHDVVRIYNGLDLHRFAPNGAAADEPPLVLAVGRLVEKKGFDVLIRACGLLRAGGIRFRCLIVGKGELAGELQALISSLGLGQQVELAGAVPRERLPELFRRASVVAAPCVVGGDGNRDGLPTVLTEALASKVPVVATPVTGIPELVEDGRTGLLVPERDPAALAAAVRRLLEDPDAARRLAEAGRERVERDFDLRENVGELRELFEKAVAR